MARLLFSTTFKLLDNNVALHVQPKVIPHASISGDEELTASLYLEMPPADGRGLYPGGVRVACIFDKLAIHRTHDAVIPDPPPDSHPTSVFDHDRPDEDAFDRWMRFHVNLALVNRGSGRVHVFLGDGYCPFKSTRERFWQGDYPREEPHNGCFAVIVHVPADGGRVSVWPDIQVRYNECSGSGDTYHALEPMRKDAMVRIVMNMKWRDC
jgi:hypothetical protein